MAMAHCAKDAIPPPGSDYFLTVCLQRPSTTLGDPEVRQGCLTEILRLENEQAWTLRCAVIMPDHIHLLVTLRSNDGLSSAMRLLKGRLTPLLRKHQASWQENFYDHCLRPEEDLLPVFLYLFLNPYRKKLISTDQRWAGYYCSADNWTWFGSLTRESCPEPDWLG